MSSPSDSLNTTPHHGAAGMARSVPESTGAARPVQSSRVIKRFRTGDRAAVKCRPGGRDSSLIHDEKDRGTSAHQLIRITTSLDTVTFSRSLLVLARLGPSLGRTPGSEPRAPESLRRVTPSVTPKCHP